jgi:DNA-binding YbaB/EbfC family protein
MSRGGGGFGPMQQLMQQAQKMQENMKKVQEEVGARTQTVESGGGLVKVTMNGKLELIEIQLKKECVDPTDIDMLQDLVKSAVNEAIRECQQMMSSEMQKVSGGISIPGLF